MGLTRDEDNDDATTSLSHVCWLSYSGVIVTPANAAQVNTLTLANCTCAFLCFWGSCVVLTHNTASTRASSSALALHHSALVTIIDLRHNTDTRCSVCAISTCIEIEHSRTHIQSAASLHNTSTKPWQLAAVCWWATAKVMAVVITVRCAWRQITTAAISNKPATTTTIRQKTHRWFWPIITTQTSRPSWRRLHARQIPAMGTYGEHKRHCIMCVFDVTTRHFLQTCMCGYVCFMNGGAREQCVEGIYFIWGRGRVVNNVFAQLQLTTTNESTFSRTTATN